jgi:hypothetical protein
MKEAFQWGGMPLEGRTERVGWTTAGSSGSVTLRGLVPWSASLLRQLAIGGLTIAEGMPLGVKASRADLSRQSRSARITTPAAMKPNDRTGGTGAGLFKGAAGMHCSGVEQSCAVGVEGADSTRAA